MENIKKEAIRIADIKETIIERMDEYKKKNNSLLIPINAIREDILAERLFRGLRELKRDDKIHVLDFRNCHNYRKKYGFNELMSGVKRIRYAFFNEDLNEVYDLMASNLFEAQEKNNFTIIKGYEDYFLRIKVAILFLLKNAGFSEHEARIISDIFDYKILDHIEKNNMSDIKLSESSKMKRIILRYLFEKDNNKLENYSYDAFITKVKEDMKKDGIDPDQYYTTVGQLKSNETLYFINFRDFDKEKNEPIYKKFVILKKDKERFFELLIKRIIEDNKNLNAEDLLKIFEYRVDMSSNLKSMTSKDIFYLIEKSINEIKSKNLINEPGYAIYPREKL